MTDPTYVRSGIAILNPYGGIWTNDIFQTPEEAVAYLKEFWKGKPVGLHEYKLAAATQTVTLDRTPGDLTIIDLPLASPGALTNGEQKTP